MAIYMDFLDNITFFKERENMTEFEDKYYSMHEICKYLGISRDSVLKWIVNKGMLAHKAGKKLKFKLSEIDAWVNSGKAEE